MLSWRLTAISLSLTCQNVIFPDGHMQSNECVWRNWKYM